MSARILFLMVTLHAALPGGLAAQSDSDCGDETDCVVSAIGDILKFGASLAGWLAGLEEKAAAGCPPGTYPSRCGKLIPVVEATVSYRTTGGGGGRWFATWEAGGLVRVAERTAVGAGYFLNADDGGHRFGFRARIRHWLGSELALDVGPGFFFTASEKSQRAPGFSGLLTIGNHDAALIFQVERILDREPYLAQHAADWRTYLGLNLRGEGAVGLTVLEIGVVLVAAAAAF